MRASEVQPRLYHNLGNGEFELASGFTGPSGNHFVPVWVDYDNDGFVDLFVTGVPNPNHLYRNNGDGTFSRVTTGGLVTDIPLGGGRTTGSITTMTVSSTGTRLIRATP